MYYVGREARLVDCKLFSIVAAAAAATFSLLEKLKIDGMGAQISTHTPIHIRFLEQLKKLKLN